MRTAGISIEAYLCAILLAACLFLGGSASKPMLEMGLSILALAILLVFVWRRGKGSVPSVRWIILAATIVPVLQLLPLPSAAWETLPHARFVLSLPAEAQPAWYARSLSIAPDATLYSLIALAPPLVLLWGCAGLRRDERLLLLDLFVCIALLMAVIGIGQAARAWSFGLYDTQHPDVAIGLFASRNHFADLMLIATALLFAGRRRWASRLGGGVSELVLHGGLLLFLAAAVGSASRAGCVLFVAVAFFGYLLTVRVAWRVPFLAASACLAAGLWLLSTNLPQTGVIRTMVARFSLTEEGRWEIWQNSLQAIKAYWPWGSGMGTFRLAYEQVEPLRSVTPKYVNAAHNEYLQLLIEGGVLQMIAALLIAAWVMFLVLRQRRNPIVQCALLALLAVLLHSLVDYPWRVLAITSAIALCVGIILGENDARRDDERVRRVPS